MNDQDPLRFPVGPFQPRPSISPDDREALIGEIEALPGILREVLDGIPESLLDTPYREGGWTVRQVVHHIPDSHIQGYARFKLAMSEEVPTIKTYQQPAWGAMVDSVEGPLEPSLLLLEGLHARWGMFLRSLTDEDFRRTYKHPDMGELSLDTTVQLYAWHGRHHLGHVRLVVVG
jgi:hypothetical protein